MSKKILVVGGTGLLGKPVAEKLSTSGFEVTVLSTNVEKARGNLPENIAIEYGDVTNIESLKKPIEGKDFVYINVNAKLTPELYESIEIGGCEDRFVDLVNFGLSREKPISLLASQC